MRVAAIEVMDELIKPLFWKFTSVAYVGFTYGSIIISFFSFVLCIGELALTNIRASTSWHP